MKGVSTTVWVVIVVAIMFSAIIGTASVYTLSALSAVSAAVEYDGEFDDAYLPTDGWFFSDFKEEVDCNITNDVLGGSGYISCIYQNRSALDLTLGNSTDYEFSIVLDIDGPVEKMDIDAALKNSGTGQFRDDMVIKVAKLYTHENEPVLIADLEPYIEDNVDIDGSVGPLEAGEYVLYTVLHSKDLAPVAAAGDDVMTIDLDLTTSGDADSARITAEIA